MSEAEFEFDGDEQAPGEGCANCGRKRHEHDKERVYGGKGPSGSYHYEYVCPTE